MAALQRAEHQGQQRAALRDQKVLSVPAGDNVVRLLPPLVISEDEIRIGLDRIRSGVRSLARATATASVEPGQYVGNSVRHFIDLSTVSSADAQIDAR